MALSIYTWAYGEEIYNVLTAVQFYTHNSYYMVISAFALGLLVVALKSMTVGIDEKNAIIGMVFVASIFLVPSNEDFMIEDEATGYAQNISGLPVGIGVALSLSSNIEKALSEAFRNGYSTPNSISMENVGIGFSMSAPLKAQQAMPTDELLVETFNQYVNNCLVGDLTTGAKTLNTITSSGALVSDLAVSNQLETLIFDTANPTGVQDSCQNAWTNISARIDVESSTYIQNNIVPAMGLPADKINDGLAGTANLIYGVSSTGKDLVKQDMARNLLNNGLMAMGQIVGGDTASTALMAAQSEAKAEGAMIGAGLQAMHNLPNVRVIGTSLIIGLIPLLAWLSIAFASWKFIPVIVGGFGTLSLWQPIGVLLNYFYYSKAEKVLQPLSNGTLAPISSSMDVTSTISDYMSMLMWIYTAIPMISYAIITGGGMAALYAVRGLADASSASGAQVGGEVRQGNVNFGNQNSGNHTVDNDRVGLGNYMRPDGSYTKTDSVGGMQRTHIGSDGHGNSYQETSYQGSGGNSTTVETGHAGTVGLDGNGNIRSYTGGSGSMSVDAAQQYSHSQAAVQEQAAQQEFDKTVAKTVADMARFGSSVTDSSNLAHHLGVDKSTAESVSKATSSAASQSLREAYSQEKLAQMMNESSASIGGGVQAHIKAGTPLEEMVGSGVGVQVGADGRVSVSGTRANGDKYSFKMDHDESKQFMEKFENNLTKTLNQTEGLSLDLAKNMSVSNAQEHSELRNTQEAFKEAHSVSERTSDTFNKVAQYAQSHKVDLAPRVLEQFIQNDKLLSEQWNTQGSDHARIAAEAANRMQYAQQSPNENIVDARNFNNSMNQVYTEFAKSNNLINDVQDNLNHPVNSQPVINQGKDAVESFHVKPVDTHLNTQSGSFHNQAGAFTGQGKSELKAFDNHDGLDVKHAIESRGGHLNNATDTKLHESVVKPVSDFMDNTFNNFKESELAPIHMIRDMATKEDVQDMLDQHIPVQTVAQPTTTSHSQKATHKLPEDKTR